MVGLRVESGNTDGVGLSGMDGGWLGVMATGAGGPICHSLLLQTFNTCFKNSPDSLNEKRSCLLSFESQVFRKLSCFTGRTGETCP